MLEDPSDTVCSRFRHRYTAFRLVERLIGTTSVRLRSSGHILVNGLSDGGAKRVIFCLAFLLLSLSLYRNYRCPNHHDSWLGHAGRYSSSGDIETDGAGASMTADLDTLGRTAVLGPAQTCAAGCMCPVLEGWARLWQTAALISCAVRTPCLSRREPPILLAGYLSQRLSSA